MRYTRNTGTMMKMKIQENKQIEVSRFSGLSGYRDHFSFYDNTSWRREYGNVRFDESGRLYRG